MIRKGKVLIALLLSLMMIFSTVSVAFASENSKVTVEIISFMRGAQANLRSSELLEARVSGYDGNVRELTYKWKSSLGTYVYVYNSHNMYNINNTDGEIEIHNTSKSVKGLSNMVGRTYDKEFSGKGFVWASVYGANIGNNSLQGTLTVEVYDENGTLLCSDSHEGSGSGNKRKGFVYYNLDDDMDNVVIGLFEGDKRNVKDLLGESAIVHITCVESSVDDGRIISGADHINLKKENGDYYITGTVAGTSTDSDGDAQVDLDITKGNCKFHNKTSGDAVTTVFVFKKPTTDTTTTTLTLTGNLDDRCDYFIGGVQGTKQSDGTIIFTGLTPNTTYTVEVRGEYKDKNGTTKYAYAYVYDTTKPVYKATVNTYLDDVLTDIGDIHGDDVTLYLHEDAEGAEYIALQNEGKGVYTAEVTNGIYLPWHIEAGDHYHKAKEFKLIVENANGSLDLHHYSVNYDANGGVFADGAATMKEIYPSASVVSATNSIPVREGYVFAGWVSGENTYAAGDEVASRIAAPITLTAKWAKQVNVTVNVTIDHKYQNGYDHNTNKDELLVELLEMAEGSPAFIETGDKLYFTKEKVTDENGLSKSFEYETETATDGTTVLVTKYTANAPTYTGLIETSVFGVALSKSGYDVGTIEKTVDTNGNWTINIPLTYNPDDFDVEFSVEMADDVPTELYPDAVIVKVACWDENAKEWVIISQQRTTDLTVRPGVRVDIDPVTGKGFGSYPVWNHNADGSAYGYRAVVTGFIYDNKTISTVSVKEENNAVIAYTDGNYTATMGDISDGKLYSTTLYGAYYNEETNAQQGTLHGVISVEKYDVTFDANSGTVNGAAVDIAREQYYIPDFDSYVPYMENHSFLGWYADENCTVPATEGKLLTEDVTLYAKWDKLLTGTLIVDGYYTDEKGTQHKVDDVDRATHALVELEEIFDGRTYDIAGQTVEIKWADGHTSEPVNYEFKNLDPDKTYRINVYLMNYEAAYQNSTTVINGNGDIHDDYNENDYTAVYTAESKYETFVNTFLHFEPEEFSLNVEIDSTRIGESFRPEDALVKYYSEEIGVDDDYVLIVQHKDENEGVKVYLDTKTGTNDGTYGDKVWKKNFNGNLYDYQAELTKLDGKSTEEWPVIITYGDSVRWSPYNQAPTDTLKVTVIPRWYNINYDFNGIKDEAGNNIVETISRGHIWSHETTISYAPECEGYLFLGWYANPECTGDAVTMIPAAVAEDIYLYAKWEKRTDLELTVTHMLKDGAVVLEKDIKGNQTFGDVVTAESLKKEFKGYSYDSASAEIITIGTENNEITLWYMPDSYDYTVNYLEEGTNKPLGEAKTFSASYGSEVQENAVVIEGYSVSGDSIKAITIDTANNVINFYYTANTSVDPDTPDKPDTPDTPEIPDTPVEPDVPGGNGGNGEVSGNRKHNVVFGKTNSIGWYNVSFDGGETYQMVFGNSTLEVVQGTEMIIKAGDLVGGSFTFYINGNAVKPDENGCVKVIVDGYMLIGALSIDVEIPDVEESLNWFQKIIKAIKDFFAWLFGKK